MAALPTIEAIGDGWKDGDVITVEEVHHPSWWRRLLLREKPSTRTHTLYVEAARTAPKADGFVEVERTEAGNAA